MDKINYRWCTLNDIVLSDKLAELFVGNTNNNYISHGEVIDGRANSMNEWKGEIKEIMRDEFTEAMGNSFDLPDTFSKLAIALQDKNIIALALIEFHPKTKVIILSDIVVNAQLRGQKIGELMFSWIETEAKTWGVKYIFLESGNSNHSAHRFFERVGFHTSSVVMVKEI